MRAGGRSTAEGPGRLLVAVYAVFALSASARSLVQISTDFSAAPLAYALSGVAAVVYVAATFALARDARSLAWAAVLVELVGVLAIGTLSVLQPADFADATVWSRFGQGYGYVPLVLPVFGLLWLGRTGAAD
ncbi:MAG: Integral membrane protein [uncultured Nocardioidaceae bacterium]|uniref:Integral membrane protein n=1 Tax=uncultured Nocardioidaceae bacterium TaxID=253824 RepID=A0A6J4LZ38_9ACTN|nr:MAG: Integral membrane protein [uncultured Nocardioidaceae bacterium]